MAEDAAPAPHWRARVIETGDFALDEQEAGAGPPLLCLGFDDPQASRLLDDLAASFTLISLNAAAASLGASDALDAHGFARAALDCADRLALKRFPVLARGDEDHAALCLSLLAPQRVCAVALLAPDLHSRDGAAEDAELLERLREVATPVLAVFGAMDRVATPATARLWRERLPDAKMVFVQDAAQDVDRERPRATARVVADFMTRHCGDAPE